MGELTLAEHQVHSEVNLSLTSSTGQGRESPWIKIWTGRDPSPINHHGQNNLHWGKLM